MASTSVAADQTLEKLARRHLWMHFTRMSAYQHSEIPIIVRGDGCYVYDQHGKRYLDGLSALYCVNVGHGRAEIVQAGADQARELGFYSTWVVRASAGDRACRPCRGARARGPEPRVLHQRRLGSRRVRAEARRQYHKLTGKPNKTKVIAREIAYHGTSLGALSMTGITYMREPFEPLTPGAVHVPNTNTYRLGGGMDESYFSDAIAERIDFEGPDTVAAVILEPVQNAGGCFTPPDGYFQRVREICDHYDVLLISDEVICAWGRLGEWFGCERYGYQPDIVTTAKGLTSAYAPIGAMIASDRIAEPFLEGTNSFAHGFTFGGHPVCAAIALANLDVLEREGIIDNVREHEPEFRAMLESLRELPIVGDVRGAGYFQALELVKDKQTKESFTDEESETLLRGFLSGELYRRGLICRADAAAIP